MELIIDNVKNNNLMIVATVLHTFLPCELDCKLPSLSENEFLQRYF